MDELELSSTRKVLETFIEIPDVLYTLILKFVGPYEWSDLKNIPLGVTCTCMLNVIIHMGGTLTMWCKGKLRRCDKVYVMRWKSEYGNTFTFKLTIDGKSYELLYGVINTYDEIVFRPDLNTAVFFVPVVS